MGSLRVRAERAMTIRGQAEAIAAGADDGRPERWPRLLTVESVAQYLGLAVQTVRNRSLEVPGRRTLGRKVVYDRAIIDRWLDQNDGTRDLWLDARRMIK